MPSNDSHRDDEAAYAGRWVARVEGRIVAQAETETAALLAAKAQRHKEKVEVEFVSVDHAARFGPLVDRVAAIAQDEPIFLVGGAVRDALLGNASHDFDFALPRVRSNARWHVANALGAAFYVLDAEFEASACNRPGGDGRPRRTGFLFVSWTRPGRRSRRKGLHDRRHGLRSAQENRAGSDGRRQ